MNDLDHLAVSLPPYQRSIFTARHYEYFALLCATVRVDHGDWTLEHWLAQAFSLTQPNFNPTRFKAKTNLLARQRQEEAEKRRVGG